MVKPTTPGAQEAVLTYQVIDMSAGLSLVRIELRTGRPHQIRVQMAASGHPLVGDQRYGPAAMSGSRSPFGPKQFLCCTPQPKSGWTLANRLREKNLGPILDTPDRIGQALFLSRPFFYGQLLTNG